MATPPSQYGTPGGTDESSEYSTPEKYRKNPIQEIVRNGVKYEKSIIPLRNPVSYYGKKVKELGKGTLGEVAMYSGKNAGDVAIKMMKYNVSDDEGVTSAILREFSVTIRMKHPNVISMIGMSVDPGKSEVYMVMTMAKTDLLNYIRDKKHDFLPIKATPAETDKSVAYQIICGVNYCLSKGILNRDIKSPNVLIYEDGTVKVADFGLARTAVCAFDSGITNEVYTLYYRPPEVILGGRYEDAADVWAVGCVLYDLYATQFLFPGDNENDMMARFWLEFGNLDSHWPAIINLPNWRPLLIAKSRSSKLDRVADKSALRIIRGMLMIDPSKRSRLQDVLKDPYFDSVRVPKNEVHEAYSCIRILEERSELPISGMQHQKEITRAMVTTVYDWLIEVARSFKLFKQTFYLSQAILEKYMAIKSIGKSKIQLYACACMSIASKIVEIYAPESNDFVYISAGEFTIEDLDKTSIEIASVLNFDLVISTSQDFLNVMINSGNYTSQVKQISNILLRTFTLSDKFYFKYAPQEMALGCLFAACTYADCTFKHSAHITPRITEFMKDFAAFQINDKHYRKKLFEEDFDKVKIKPEDKLSSIQMKVKNQSTKVL